MLKDNNIEARPVWYPNHLQKPYINNQNYEIEKANYLVSNTLCLPSHNNLSEQDIENIIKIIKKWRKQQLLQKQELIITVV